MIKNVLDKDPPSEKTWTDQWTPLHWEAHNGHFDICEVLISHMSWKNPGDPTGWTPLHSAAQNGHLRVVKLILSYFSASKEYPIPYNTYGICRVFWYDMFGFSWIRRLTCLPTSAQRGSKTTRSTAVCNLSIHTNKDINQT